MTVTQEMEPTESRATAELLLTTQMVTIISMDPRLQRFVAQRRSGARRAATEIKGAVVDISHAHLKYRPRPL